LGAFTDPTSLADFGLVPHKPRTAPTGEKMATAAARNRATRAARHTMGRRRKLAIKGSVPTPVTDGSAGAPGGSAPGAPVVKS